MKITLPAVREVRGNLSSAAEVPSWAAEGLRATLSVEAAPKLVALWPPAVTVASSDGRMTVPTVATLGHTTCSRLLAGCSVSKHRRGQPGMLPTVAYRCLPLPKLLSCSSAHTLAHKRSLCFGPQNLLHFAINQGGIDALLLCFQANVMVPDRDVVICRKLVIAAQLIR